MKSITAILSDGSGLFLKCIIFEHHRRKCSLNIRIALQMPSYMKYEDTVISKTCSYVLIRLFYLDFMSFPKPSDIYACCGGLVSRFPRIVEEGFG